MVEMMYIRKSQKGKVVYELAKELATNPSRIAATQALTLDKEKPSAGLSGRHGLFASDDWWRSLEDGRIAVGIYSGVIQDLYLAGMDANEENGKDFDYLCDDGKIRSESCTANNEEDLSMYCIGARVTLVYALDELKKQPARDGRTNFAEVLLEIAIE